MVKVCTAKGKQDIEALLDLGGELSIAVAYVDKYGFNLIEKCLKAAPSKVKKVRLLVDLKSGVTHPDAVKRMVELSEEERDRFECKEYYIKGHRHAILHSKLLISRNGNSVSFLTGSCNLTQNAIERNEEHGVWVECNGERDLADNIMADFRKLWKNKDRATTIDYSRATEYGRIYRKNRSVDRSKEDLPPPGSSKYWQLKCNPAKHEGYTFCRLLVSEDRRDYWSEKITLQESIDCISEMKIGDLALFQHSGYSNPKDNVVVGTVRVVREAYECPNDLTKKVVDIQVESEFACPIPLSEIRGFYPGLRDNPPIQQVKVSQNTWDEIVALGTGETP